jgi:hypothetical protein
MASMSDKTKKIVKNDDITAEFVRTILSYDPQTGLFTHLYRPDRDRPWNGRYAGKIAGNPFTTNRYVVIHINGVLRAAHRLAWLWMTGEWPEELIDHADGVKSNNKWCNLRKATCSQNVANSAVKSNNSSGYKGVHFVKSRGNWCSQIMVNGVRITLGSFPTAELAHKKYCEKAAELNGEFFRT